MFKVGLLFFTVLLLADLPAFSVAQTCPLTGFDALGPGEFELDKFLKRWYSLAQKEVFFQPENQFFCVFAEYTANTKDKLFIEDPKFDVFNSGRVGKVDGPQNTIKFLATVPDETNAPAKAWVGSPSKPSVFRDKKDTNYWVIDVGQYSDLGIGTPDSTNPYQWAIILAGEPDQVGANNLCFAENGFWFFTSDPNPPAGVFDALNMTATTEFGLDTSVLKLVQQEGCEYSRGSFLTNIVGNVAGFFDALWAQIMDLFDS